ncbi:MAG: DUF1549 domain-containing protein [Bryobacteraceae bacterium]
MQTRQLLPRLLSGIALPAIPWCATSARNANLWRLKPVQRPRVPCRADAVRQPERGVHCRQAQEKVLRPAVRADKATFPRRGLSRSDRNPSPAEQEAFLADTNPNADEEVDRLLASKQYGARYARHWLDVLRYAEVDGAMAPRPESTTPNE